MGVVVVGVDTRYWPPEVAGGMNVTPAPWGPAPCWRTCPGVGVAPWAVGIMNRQAPERTQVADSVGIVVDSVGIVVDSAGIVVDSVEINHHQVAQWCSELQTAQKKNR